MQFVHIRTYIHTCRAYININKCDSFCVVIYSTKFSESLTPAASGRRQNAPNSFFAGAPDPAGKAHDAPSDALVGWGGGVGHPVTILLPSMLSAPRLPQLIFRSRAPVCTVTPPLRSTKMLTWQLAAVAWQLRTGLIKAYVAEVLG